MEVILKCKGCGVRMSTLASDDEVQRASNLPYVKGMTFWDRVAQVVIKERLLTRWNTRHTEVHA